MKKKLCFLICAILLNLQSFAQTNQNLNSIINSYLIQNQNELSLTDRDIQEYVITDNYFSSISDLDYIYVNQIYQGIKIHNAISTFALRQNEVFNFSNRFEKNLQY